MADFQAQARRALRELRPTDERRFFVAALLSTTEYEMFLSLMHGEARKHAGAQREAGEAGAKSAAEAKRMAKRMAK